MDCARPCRFRSSASVSLLRRVEQAGLRRRCRSLRALALNRPRRAAAPSTDASTAPSPKCSVRRARRARVARVGKVLPVAARSPARSRASSGRSGCASSAIRHSAAEPLGQPRDRAGRPARAAARPATRLRSARACPARAASERGSRSPSSSSALRHRREDRLRLAASGKRQVEALAAALGAARRGMLRAMLPSSPSCANSSARTGTAISAAAVGVGARRSAA